MTNKDYIYLLGSVLLVAGSIVMGGFWGGYLAGFFSAIILFSTVGKIAFRKTEKRIDIAIRLKRMMDEKI